MRRRAVVVAAGVLVVAGAVAASLAATLGPSRSSTSSSTTTDTSVPTTVPQPSWRVAWGSAMAWGYGTAANTTVRDLATVSVGGSQIRIRISNAFGDAPLVVGAATVAPSAGGAAIDPGAMQKVRFSGAPGTTIPVGQVMKSDPVSLTVNAGETLAISIYVSTPDVVTNHPCCAVIQSYFAPNGAGNLTASPTGRELNFSDATERWVDAVDVLRSGAAGSIVVLGDSISDGFNYDTFKSTTSWVTLLQQRIGRLPAAEQRAVVNEGIAANTLTSDARNDSAVGGGPAGLDRMERDVLSQAGVTDMVIELGTNDLWFGVSSQQLIQGFQQAISAAHRAGIRVIGVTLLPRASDTKEIWSPAQQAELEQVDTWIRTSGAFDGGVIDFAPVVADVYNHDCAPNMLFPAYDSGDHLHPNAAGDAVMANAVDATILGLGTLPSLPAPVPVTPTPGCNAAVAPAAAP